MVEESIKYKINKGLTYTNKKSAGKPVTKLIIYLILHVLAPQF